MQLSLEKAFSELRSLRRQDRKRDLTSHIEAMLLQPWPDADARVLRGELIAELHRQDRLAEAEIMLRGEVERDPREPFHSLSLAEHFHYYDVNPPESLKHVADAMAKAELDGKFMYQALDRNSSVASPRRHPAKDGEVRAHRRQC